MKKFIIIMSICFSQIALSQSSDHVEGGRFLKRVEYNVISPGTTEADNRYNLLSKSILDRIFFGETNSLVEFVFRGSAEGINEVSAFRIIKKSQTYSLEIMRIPNVEEVYKLEQQLSAEVNEIVIPNKLLGSISSEGKDLISAHNKEAARAAYSGDLYKPYRPKAQTFQISKQFAEKLHDKTASLIHIFKSEGIPPTIFDGYEMTFRCVVGNEVWTLTVHEPQGRVLQLADVFRQIMSNYRDKTDESKYFKLLDEIKL